MSIKKHLFALFIFLLLCPFSAGAQEDKKSEKPEFVNSIGMKFKLIPAGSFYMGGDGENERPHHKVFITKPFYMGVNEVTQEEFEKVMGKRLSDHKGVNMPAGNVTWNDAAEFCRRLSEKSGRKYRLPTEAEWEYAARGGMEGKKYVWGNENIPVVNGKKQANIADEACKMKFNEEMTLSGYNDGFGGPSPVGSFAANGFGLYDMAGNVWERCGDWYEKDYYKTSPLKDPPGPSTGSKRVMRGGGYCFYNPEYLRVAYRCGSPLDRAGGNDGFRVVMELD